MFTFKWFLRFFDVLSPSLLKLSIDIVLDKKMHLFNHDKSHVSALEQVTPLAVEKGSINSKQETVSQ